MVLASPTAGLSGGRAAELTEVLRSLLVRLPPTDLSASLDSLSSKALRERFFRNSAAWLTSALAATPVPSAFVPGCLLGSSIEDDVLADGAVRSFGGAGKTAELRRRLYRSVSCADWRTLSRLGACAGGDGVGDGLMLMLLRRLRSGEGATSEISICLATSRSSSSSSWAAR